MENGRNNGTMLSLHQCLSVVMVVDLCWAGDWCNWSECRVQIWFGQVHKFTERWIWTSKKNDWTENEMEERSHTSTHRGHVPRQSSDQRSAVERAPPSLLASLKKKKKLKPKSLLWLQTRVLCFNMNTIFKTGHHLRRTGTGSLLLRHVGPTLKRTWGLSWLQCTGVFLNQLAIRGATQAQTVPCSCPYASPSKGGAQYRYKGNEGWYLHPILETFPKALRFILL